MPTAYTIKVTATRGEEKTILKGSATVDKEGSCPCDVLIAMLTDFRFSQNLETFTKITATIDTKSTR